MEKNNYIFKGLLNAAGVAAYISIVAWFLNHAQKIFGQKPDNFFMPIFMLLLLVISATVTGFLVLGKPLQLYWENQKQAATSLLFSTVGWLGVFLLLAAIAITLV